MSFFKTPHIWCFFVLRCLIYKVHAPTAERILGYHIFPTLSTLFLCFCNFSSLTTEEGKPLSESRPLFANRSYLSTPPELLQVLILHFSFFGQTAQSGSLISVITVKNSKGRQTKPASLRIFDGFSRCSRRRASGTAAQAEQHNS